MSSLIVFLESILTFNSHKFSIAVLLENGIYNSADVKNAIEDNKLIVKFVKSNDINSLRKYSDEYRKKNKLN